MKIIWSVTTGQFLTTDCCCPGDERWLMMWGLRPHRARLDFYLPVQCRNKRGGNKGTEYRSYLKCSCIFNDWKYHIGYSVRKIKSFKKAYKKRKVLIKLFSVEGRACLKFQRLIIFLLKFVIGSSQWYLSWCCWCWVELTGLTSWPSVSHVDIRPSNVLPAM